MKTTRLNFKNPIREGISRIRFAPSSNNLLVSSWDSKLRLYDVDSCKLRLEACSGAPPLDCCFESDGVALSANSDGSINRFDLHSGNDVSIGKHDDSATCIEFSDETCQIVSAGWDRKILLWDARSTKSLCCLSKVDIKVESLSLTGFSLKAASGSSIKIYDLRNYKNPVQAKESFMGIPIKCVRPILGSEGFVVGSVDGRVALEYLNQSDSTNQGYVFRCYPKGKDGKHHLVSVNDIAFNPHDSGAFVTGDNEGYATIWDARCKKRLFDLDRYPNSVASLTYNCDGLLLAVASSCTYQEANESEEPPQIFIHEIDNSILRSVSASRKTKQSLTR